MDRLNLAQSRSIIGVLDWSMMNLARLAGVSVATVKRIEMDPPQAVEAVAGTAYGTVEAAFAAVGLCFLADEGDEDGVRLQR